MRYFFIFGFPTCIHTTSSPPLRIIIYFYLRRRRVGARRVAGRASAVYNACPAPSPPPSTFAPSLARGRRKSKHTVARRPPHTNPEDEPVVADRVLDKKKIKTYLRQTRTLEMIINDQTGTSSRRRPKTSKVVVRPSVGRCARSAAVRACNSVPRSVRACVRAHTGERAAAAGSFQRRQTQSTSR